MPALLNFGANPPPIVATLFNFGQILAPIMPTLFNFGWILAAIVPTLLNFGPNPHPIVPTLLNFGPHPPSDSERYAEIVPTSTIVPTFVPIWVQIRLRIMKGTPR